MQKWEYTSGVNLSDKQLNELGEKGWELVGIALEDTGGGVIYFYFKRPNF